MTHQHMSIPDRVMAALHLEPMTLAQLARAVSASDNYLRMAVYRLEQAGKVRRKGFQFCPGRAGATPYLWEAV